MSAPIKHDRAANRPTPPGQRRGHFAVPPIMLPSILAAVVAIGAVRLLT